MALPNILTTVFSGFAIDVSDTVQVSNIEIEFVSDPTVPSIDRQVSASQNLIVNGNADIGSEADIDFQFSPLVLNFDSSLGLNKETPVVSIDAASCFSFGLSSPNPLAGARQLFDVENITGLNQSAFCGVVVDALNEKMEEISLEFRQTVKNDTLEEVFQNELLPLIPAELSSISDLDAVGNLTVALVKNFMDAPLIKPLVDALSPIIGEDLELNLEGLAQLDFNEIKSAVEQVAVNFNLPLDVFQPVIDALFEFLLNPPTETITPTSAPTSEPTSVPTEEEVIVPDLKKVVTLVGKQILPPVDDDGSFDDYFNYITSILSSLTEEEQLAVMGFFVELGSKTLQEITGLDLGPLNVVTGEEFVLAVSDLVAILDGPEDLEEPEPIFRREIEEVPPLDALFIKIGGPAALIEFFVDADLAKLLNNTAKVIPPESEQLLLTPFGFAGAFFNGLEEIIELGLSLVPSQTLSPTEILLLSYMALINANLKAALPGFVAGQENEGDVAALILEELNLNLPDSFVLNKLELKGDNFFFTDSDGTDVNNGDSISYYSGPPAIGLTDLEIIVDVNVGEENIVFTSFTTQFTPQIGLELFFNLETMADQGFLRLGNIRDVFDVVGGIVECGAASSTTALGVATPKELESSLSVEVPEEFRTPLKRDFNANAVFGNFFDSFRALVPGALTTKAGESTKVLQEASTGSSAVCAENSVIAFNSEGGLAESTVIAIAVVVAVVVLIAVVAIYFVVSSKKAAAASAANAPPADEVKEVKQTV